MLGRIQHLPGPLCFNPEVNLGVWHVRQTTLVFPPTSDSSTWQTRCLHTCSLNSEPSAESAKVKNSDKPQPSSVASWLGDSESVSLVSSAVSLLRSSPGTRGMSIVLHFFWGGGLWRPTQCCPEATVVVFNQMPAPLLSKKYARQSYIIPYIQNANSTESKTDI